MEWKVSCVSNLIYKCICSLKICTEITPNQCLVWRTCSGYLSCLFIWIHVNFLNFSNFLFHGLFHGFKQIKFHGTIPQISIDMFLFNPARAGFFCFPRLKDIINTFHSRETKKPGTRGIEKEHVDWNLWTMVHSFDIWFHSMVYKAISFRGIWTTFALRLSWIIILHSRSLER